MKVSELIEKLKTLPQDLEVVTNECEATSAHEEISDDLDVGLYTRTDIGKTVVFVGSSGYVE